MKRFLVGGIEYHILCMYTIVFLMFKLKISFPFLSLPSYSFIIGECNAEVGLGFVQHTQVEQFSRILR